MISRSRSETQQRHLKELLSEDQEPFHLSSYIAQNKKQQPPPPPSSAKHLQLKKKQNASFQSHFCKNACFFSTLQLVDSPECYKKSPLLSPAAAAAWGDKSPSRAMFLHVPAKTAALLLEAACRIQKNSAASPQKAKPKPQVKSSGFGRFGSVFKRFTTRNRPRKIKTGDSGEVAGDTDVIRWADSVKTGDEIRVGSGEGQTGFSQGRLSSVWSEENKSLACSSSSSTCCSGNLSEEEVKIGFVNPLEAKNGRKMDEDFTFCSSPLSPFRFVLQKSPSPGRRSPAFCSPAASPSRRKYQENVKYEEQDPSVKFQVEDEEEEKEQCSPVSILDPPFGDDDCEEEEGDCNGDEDDFDMECSYAFVQRAKQHLLQKLRNFEKLAELDPIELEKRMVEEEDEDDSEDLDYEADNDDDDHSSSVDVERSIEGYLVDIARKSGLVQDLLSPGMKRLLSDLISEEEKPESSGDSYESIVKRVCKRLGSWKEVEPNTIEMMVAMDLKGENDMWKKAREETSQTAKMVELSIFAALLEELLDELIMCY